MLVDKEILSEILVYTAELWKKNSASLGEIDARFGDGDHGITIGKIAGVFEECVKNWKNESIKETIKTLGDKILAINGGSAGPLYGTLIGGLAEPLSDEKVIDGAMLKKMLRSSCDEISALTKARVGDKTMMDALIPAVEAALSTPGDYIPDILDAAEKAAARGAEYTGSIASKFGRARSYGDKTIGTPDAGAVSTSLLFQGFSEGIGESMKL